MRILWISDNPFSNSSYSLQSQRTIKMFENEHEFLYYGIDYVGNPTDRNGISVVGKSNNRDKSGLINYYTDYFKPDIIYTMKDVHGFSLEVTKNMKVPWCAFIPVDTEPLNLVAKTYFRNSTYLSSPTKYNIDELKRHHTNVFHTPHEIDKDIFQNKSNPQFRKKFNIQPNDFVVSFIGDNSSINNRKNIDSVLMAWRIFCENKKDVRLFLHTNIDGEVKVSIILEALDVDKRKITFTPQDYYLAGSSVEYIANIYQISNVYLSPSGGEGFNLPIVEAQISGVPVITSKFSAHHDTFGVGWCIEKGEHIWDNSGGFRFRPALDDLVGSLENAYDLHKNGKLASYSDSAREFAMRYSDVKSYWKTMFDSIESDLK